MPHNVGALGNDIIIPDANYRLLSGDDSEICPEVLVRDFTDLFIINFFAVLSYSILFNRTGKAGLQTFTLTCVFKSSGR